MRFTCEVGLRNKPLRAQPRVLFMSGVWVPSRSRHKESPVSVEIVEAVPAALCDSPAAVVDVVDTQCAQQHRYGASSPSHPVAFHTARIIPVVALQIRFVPVSEDKVFLYLLSFRISDLVEHGSSLSPFPRSLLMPLAALAAALCLCIACGFRPARDWTDARPRRGGPWWTHHAPH